MKVSLGYRVRPKSSQTAEEEACRKIIAVTLNTNKP